MRKTTLKTKLFVALFCVLLLFVGLYRSESFDETFSEKLELREELISLAMNFKHLVLRDNLFNKLMYTKNSRWLNYIGELSLDDFQNAIPFTPKQLETIQTKLDSIQQNLDQRGIKFYVVIPPNKNTIYPEDLEEILTKFQLKSRLDQLVEYQSTHPGLDVIDMRPELLEAKKTNLVYTATGTHWNDYGSWVGYNKIMSIISQDFPQLVPNPIENYDVSQEKFSGELASLSGNLLTNEFVERLTLRNPRDVTHHPDLPTQASEIYEITSYINDPELAVALVYRDSFYYKLNNHMNQHFRKSVCLWRFSFEYEKVDEIQPDLVIFEVTERYIDFLLRLN
jgi:hypothetical protein